MSKDRINKIVESTHTNGGKTPYNLVDEMFEIHNSIFEKTKEYNKGCSKCRGRVFARIQTLYNLMKKENQ